jgi:hypothetical protein
VIRAARCTTCAGTALILAATAVLAATGAATAGGAVKVIGHGTQLKGTKIWLAQAKSARPHTLSARVVPQPAQPVKVQWSVVCQKPNSFDPAIQIAATSKSGEVSLVRPATVKLALPFARSPTCVASVYATLARGGKLVLRVIQT